jgi:hypothetical protein
MRGYFCLLTLLPCDDIALGKRVDQFLKSRVRVVGDLVTVHPAHRVLEHNPRNHACFHPPTLLPIGFRVVKKVIKGLCSYLVAQVSQKAGLYVHYKMPEHFQQSRDSLN